MYGEFQIQKEYMGDTVGMTAVRRWMISKLDRGDWVCIDTAPSLKEAMTWVDRKESQKRSEKIMTKMIEDHPSIRQMFKDLGYATK